MAASEQGSTPRGVMLETWLFERVRPLRNIFVKLT